jgi:hypothetical protein
VPRPSAESIRSFAERQTAASFRLSEPEFIDAVDEPRIGACGHELTGRQRSWCSEECQKLGARLALLAKRFNLTGHEYEVVRLHQGLTCAICDKAPATGKYLSVDHDHKTGIIRGLLCTNCNLRFIGKARDPQLFYNAYEYLTNPPAVVVLGERVAPGRPRAKRRPRKRRSR